MKLFSLFVALVLTLGAPAAAVAQPGSPAPGVARVVLPTEVRPERYDIRIRPDVGALTFAGHVDIALTIVQPTDRIVLNAADLTFGRATLSGVSASPRIVLDDAQQTAAFVFDRPLSPGRRTLRIDYTGRIYQQPSGLFALDYAAADGSRKRALFTQFEASDARRFAPLWDEPGIKAVFALTVEAPDGLMSVSNMPIARRGAPTDGKRTITFQDSPRMSSYLLFLALGDFERISQTVAGVDLGVVVRRGEGAKGRYALDAAVRLLPYFNDWFGQPYPLPKLDLVAGPGSSQFFGAMENWGAIFFFDYALLLDPRLSTEADKQDVFGTVAHEMAHQWFGDLVTMSWWDDLWLNESFASWMASKATDRFHPEWNTFLMDQGGRQAAMRLDSRAGTHPVITEIPDVFAAASAFDLITYQKGQAVVRMLETYVGEDAFRAGVQRYVAAHAYGNAVSDDLWSALDAQSPGRGVVGVAHDFLKQPGVPLITAEPETGGLRLTQGRFAADESQSAPQAWRTPITVRGADGKTWTGVVSAQATARVPVQLPAVLNAGQTSYARTRYAPGLWAELAPRFASLPPADQLGLLHDSRALGETGLVPMSDYLRLAQGAPADIDPVVAGALASQLSALDGLYTAGPGRAAYRAFATSRLRPIALRLGWGARPDEPANVASARSTLWLVLGELADPVTVTEAKQRFTAWLADPTSLSGDERSTVLQIIAANADADAWQALLSRARASTDTVDRGRLYSYLGASRDPALAERTLALALSGEVTPSESLDMIRAVSGVFPDRAFDFALANRSRVDAQLEPASRNAFYPEIAQTSRDAAMLDKLSALAAAMPPSARSEADKALSTIRYRRDVIQTRLPEVDRWLAQGPPSGA